MSCGQRAACLKGHSVNDYPSPLTQRVRRLLGTGAFAQEAERPPRSTNGAHAAPRPPHRPDSGVQFESQINRLSLVLRELHAIDRAREAELRQLRERVAIAEAVAHARLAERLVPLVAQLDAMIGEAARLLQPAPPPPPSATLFDRMRARAAAGGDQAGRAALVAWASALIDLRTQLAALVEE